MKISYNTQYSYYEIFFYYIDSFGNRKRKHKRGFAKKKDAELYYHNFISTIKCSPEIKFKDLFTFYIENKKLRLRQLTLINYQRIYNNHFQIFYDMPLSKITPMLVMNWQNNLLEQNYSKKTLRNFNLCLSLIFNFACKYYKMKENPCKVVGLLKDSTDEKTDFWDLQEFEKFISCVTDLHYIAAYSTLFFAGLRVGELKALTKKDVNLQTKEISITKSYQRIKKVDIVTKPKTQRSTRILKIPDILVETLEKYFATIPHFNDNDFIFFKSNTMYRTTLDKISKIANVKQIRLHGLRHSHASLLINNGVNITAISRRLGHENINTTLAIYSHMFAESEKNLIDKMNELTKKK